MSVEHVIYCNLLDYAVFSFALFSRLILKVDNIYVKMEEFKNTANSKIMEGNEMEKLTRLAEEATSDARTAISKLAESIDNWNVKFQVFVRDTSLRLEEIKSEIKNISRQTEKASQEAKGNAELDSPPRDEEKGILNSGNDDEIDFN